MRNAVRDFKEFVLKGDVVGLAVAVLIAGAFGAVIASFTENLLTPLLAALGGEPDFSALGFTINGSRFTYGVFINAVITFLIVAAVIFFLVVRPYAAFRSRVETQGDPDLPTPEYAVESAPADALAARLGERAAEGWSVVGVSEGAGGTISALLVKGG